MTNQANLELIHKNISDAKSILIPIPELHGVHSLGSALALASVLKSQGKKVDVLCASHHLDYIETCIDTSALTSILQDTVESIITINTAQCPINSLKYDKTDSELTIYLNSPYNTFHSELVTIQPGKGSYDLIITLDTINWAQIGRYFIESPHIFLQTPTLALSSFAIMNPYTDMIVIVPEYETSAQIIFDYLKHYHTTEWSRDILNGLTLSMILDNHHSIIKDKTVLELRERGAEYDSIQYKIDHMIRDNHRLLIGRILSHIEWIDVTISGQKQRYAFSKLFPHDFTKTHTNPSDIISIFNSIKSYLPLDTSGLHILFDQGYKNKHGYIDLSTQMLLMITSELDGVFKGDILSYAYPSDKDIHIVGKELNTKIQQIINTSL